MKATTMEERIEIMESAARGEAVWRMERRMHWPKRTIRKWRQRGRQQGRSGLVSQMGRPTSGALGSYPAIIRELIEGWCQANPGWGATTLQAELARHIALTGAKLPSRATISRFLVQAGLRRRREPGSKLPSTQRAQAHSPHALWEMDARGYEKIADVGYVTLIDLNDRYSHLRLLSYPCWLGQERVVRHAQTADYQTTLRLAFMEWGLPAMLQVDHDSVFYDNRTKSPFPTRFHLWLVALGISLTFIRYHQPKDQGMTERSHQLWYTQVIQGHTFADWQALFAALLQRRLFLNQQLPCDSLNGLPPLIAYPQATHSGLPYRLEYEATLLNLQRVYDYLALGRWFRLVGDNATLSLGGQIYYIGLPWRQHQLQITFCPHSLSLLFADAAGDPIISLPLKGLSLPYLMGNLFDQIHSPAYQPLLPFAWEQLQMARLFETIS